MQYSNKADLYTKTLGSVIRKHRLKNKKSMYLISAESSIAKSSWREIELGSRDTSLSTFCKIAEGLGIPADELLRELLNDLGKNFSFTDLNN